MAKRYGLNDAVDFAAANLVSFGGSFSRLNGQPIDKSQVWYPLDGKTGLERAQAYAATAAAYVGQEIAVIDVTYDADGTTVKGTSVTFYGIQDEAGTLKELGSKPVGDDASIAVDANGKVHLYGFNPENNGMLPQIKNGKLEWVTVSAIVQGDGNNLINNTSATVAVTSTIIKDNEGKDTNSVKYDLEVKLSKEADNALEAKDDGLYVKVTPHPEYAIAKTAPGVNEYTTKYNLTKDGTNVAEEIAVTDYTVTVETDNITDNTVSKHYVFKQLGKEIAHIDIPKDLVVSSGEVKTVTEAGKPYKDAAIGDKYIELQIANQEAPLYIPAKDLVDVYDVIDSKTVNLEISDANIISAEVKISSKTGNSLVVDEENGGLYVQVPEVIHPTVADEAVAGQVVVAVSQTNGAISVEREDISKLITIPGLAIAEAEEGAAATEAAIAVIAGLKVDEEDDHTIVPTTVKVASEKGLKDLADIVGHKASGEGEEAIAASGIFADLAVINTVLGNKVDASVATANNGIRFINEEEIEKLAGLDNTIATAVVDIVTGEGDGKLNIEEGAQVNIIEAIATPEGNLAIGENKQVTIPYATLTDGNRTAGLVKGATGVNKIDFVEGVGEINSLSTDKIVNGTKEFVLHGGNASGSGAAEY